MFLSATKDLLIVDYVNAFFCKYDCSWFEVYIHYSRPLLLYNWKMGCQSELGSGYCAQLYASFVDQLM